MIGSITETLEKQREQNANLPEMVLIGEPVLIAESFDMIERDGRRLRWSSSILIVLIIFLIFRSVRWMLIPVAVVQLSILLTEASLSAAGIRVTMVSSMMNAIATVIGVAATVHIIVRYRQSRRLDLNQVESMERSIRLLIAPIFWAIATDIAGFASLYFSSLGPVQDFSIMMITASAMVFLSAVLVIPGLALLPLPNSLAALDFDPTETRQREVLNRGLTTPLSWMRQYPWLLGGGSLVVSGFLAIGILFNEVESDFTKNFRSDSNIVKSYEFVESNLGGAGVWDISIPAPKTMNWPYLRSVLKLENRLRSEVFIEPNNDESSNIASDAGDRKKPWSHKSDQSR